MPNHYHINLLPWRLYAHRQRRYRFFLIILSCLVILTSYGFIIQYHKQQLIQQHQTLTQQQQQTQQQLNQLLNENQQLRQQLPTVIRVQVISYIQIKQIFQLIAQIPLTLGEFTLLELQVNEQQAIIKLQGLMPPSEFEAIQQLLKQQEWLQQIRLTHFIPQSTAWISFEFSILVKN